MFELDRDVCVDATIVEWQTAGDERTEFELKPLAQATFDAYNAAFSEAYTLALEKIIAQMIAEGVDPEMAKTEAELSAFEIAGEVAKNSAGEVLDDPELEVETSPGTASS